MYLWFSSTPKLEVVRKLIGIPDVWCALRVSSFSLRIHFNHHCLLYDTIKKAINTTQLDTFGFMWSIQDLCGLNPACTSKRMVLSFELKFLTFDCMSFLASRLQCCLYQLPCCRFNALCAVWYQCQYESMLTMCHVSSSLTKQTSVTCWKALQTSLSLFPTNVCWSGFDNCPV